MRKISAFAFAALLVMGFAASASAECGHLLRTAETPSVPKSVAQVPVTQTIKPGG
ncbi:MAG: hypothetical protein QF830_11380 [Rhodospirillales bacterium]|jgi:hypothetical protein|nr:hypothetical protein [Rhodospirillales bacterium]MDP6884729.1 hypothetical protein [Rhodospirillales bacterium]